MPVSGDPSSVPLEEYGCSAHEVLQHEGEMRLPIAALSRHSDEGLQSHLSWGFGCMVGDGRI